MLHWEEPGGGGVVVVVVEERKWKDKGQEGSKHTGPAHNAVCLRSADVS